MTSAGRATVAGVHRQRKPCRRPGRQSGLTIVELVLVIVIVGILGALTGPRFFNDRSFDERGWAEELASMLRYAQKVAVGSGCRVRVELQASSYNLTQQSPAGGHCNTADTAFPSQVGLPTGEAAGGTAPAGVSIGVPLVIVYDALGGTSLGADQTVSVGTHTLVIRAGSGLVTGP